MNEWTSTPQFEEMVRQSFSVPEIRPEFVGRLDKELRQCAAERSHKTKRVLGLRPAWAITLVILILLIFSTLVIGPQNVYATVLKLLGYIPGVGIVDQSSPIRVLAESVSITRDGITITVTSATLTADRTQIAYRIFGVPGSAYPEREDVAIHRHRNRRGLLVARIFTPRGWNATYPNQLWLRARTGKRERGCLCDSVHRQYPARQGTGKLGAAAAFCSGSA